MPNRRIWKYPLDLVAPMRIDLCDPEVRSVAVDNATGLPAMWIEHDPDGALNASVRLFMTGTGQPMDEIKDGSEYLGQFQLTGEAIANFVGHVYYKYDKYVK